MTFCKYRIVSTIGSPNSGYCLHLVLYSLKSVQLGVCLLGFSLSCESAHKTFCPCRIVSTIGFVHSGFCPYVVMTEWDYVHLGLCLLGSCALGSLAK